MMKHNKTSNKSNSKLPKISHPKKVQIIKKPMVNGRKRPIAVKTDSLFNKKSEDDPKPKKLNNVYPKLYIKEREREILIPKTL